MLKFLKFLFLGKGDVDEKTIAPEEAGFLQSMEEDFLKKLKLIDPLVSVELISSDEGKCVDRVVSRFLNVPLPFISAKLDDYRVFSETQRPYMPSVVRNMVNLCKINSLFQIPFAVYEEDGTVRRIFSEVAKTMAVSYMGHMWIVHFSRIFDFLETTQCSSVIASGFGFLDFEAEDGLVLDLPKDRNLARFLNSEKFLAHLYQHVHFVKDESELKALALEFNDFKAFFFEEHGATEEYFGMDFKTAVKDACKIKLGLDPKKKFLTIRKLHGSGWNSIVYYFQFVYEDVKVIQKGTTDIFQALAWLKHYKYKNFSIKSDMPIESVFIGGIKYLTHELSNSVELICPNLISSKLSDSSVEVFRTSRIDLLKETEEPLFVPSSQEEIDLILKKRENEEARKRKKIVLNLEEVAVQVFTLSNDITRAEMFILTVKKKFKELGILLSYEIIYTKDLESIDAQNPLNFLFYEKGQIEFKSLQMRELAKGKLLIFFDLNKFNEMFTLGSKWHFFHQLKNLGLLFDEVKFSDITKHYFEKYNFEPIISGKITGFRIRLHILTSRSFEFDTFAIVKGEILINKQIKTIKEMLIELKNGADLNKYLYAKNMSLFLFGFVIDH